MEATLGGTVVATLHAPSIPPDTRMGARIEEPGTRLIASYWREAAYVDGDWVVTLDAPITAGDYVLVFRDGGPEPPEFEYSVPLTAAR
jgi:hypothetical protein